MQAEIIAIGDELTNGARLNTNSQWLSLELAEIGIPVLFHTTVGDQLDAMVSAFRIAAGRADLIVVTGGLGPTADDLTREALSEASGRELELHEPSLAHIEAIFARRGKPMPERNRNQAYFPQGTRVIPNPEGTAPGLDLDLEPDFHLDVEMNPNQSQNLSWAGRGPCRVFALPGVPAEMHAMWKETVRPALCEGRPQRTIKHRVIKTFGAGESAVEAMLPGLIERGRIPSVGITAHQGTITLRISAEADSEADCDELIEPTARTVYECLGDLVYGEGEIDLPEAVAPLLSHFGHTLVTVELGTGGLLATAMRSTPGHEEVYRGGVCGRTMTELGSWMGFGDAVAKKMPPRSPEQVEMLAEIARNWTKADWALAVSDFPPPPAGPTAPPETFYVGLSGPDGTASVACDYSGHSAIILSRACKQAWNFLRLQLQKKIRSRTPDPVE